MAQQTILLVDDSQTCRASLSKELHSMDYTVKEASCALEALAMMQEVNPSLVLLDMTMPDLKGYQVCALIKQHPDFSNTPVFIMSAEDHAFTQAQAQMAGADSYLLKPFVMADLHKLIQHYFSDTQTV